MSNDIIILEVETCKILIINVAELSPRDRAPVQHIPALSRASPNMVVPENVTPSAPAAIPAQMVFPAPPQAPGPVPKDSDPATAK